MKELRSFVAVAVLAFAVPALAQMPPAAPPELPAEPFDLLQLYDEVRTSGPYRDLTWEDFEGVIDFVSTGGYALKTYDRFKRIVKGLDGRWRSTVASRSSRASPTSSGLEEPTKLP